MCSKKLTSGVAVAVLSIGVLGFTLPAYASFVSLTGKDCTGNVCDLFLTDATDSTSGSGNVGSKSGPGVDITTNVGSDFSSGNATIKPNKNETSLLTDLFYTPKDDTLFSDFTTRGQTLAANSTVVISVTDKSNSLFTFDFTIPKANADFSSIGVISNDGDTIKQIEVSDSSGFNQLKQAKFSTSTSPISPVPIPAAFPLFGTALIGLGAITRWRKRRQTSATT
jgi:hypothetical protein